jgi:hypothetical protein
MSWLHLPDEKVKTHYTGINDFLIIITFYHSLSYSYHPVFILMTFLYTHPITTM